MKITTEYRATIAGHDLHSMIRQFVGNKIDYDFDPKYTTVEVIADSPALTRIEARITINERKDNDNDDESEIDKIQG